MNLFIGLLNEEIKNYNNNEEFLHQKAMVFIIMKLKCNALHLNS